jgi:hypothetical protein
MSHWQPVHRILNVGVHNAENSQGMSPSASPTQLNHLRGQLDVAPSWAQMAQNLERKPRFADSSEPLFSMYCKTTKEDNKKIECWVKGVDKVVILVRASSVFLSVPLTHHIDITAGLVLYVPGCIAYRDSSGPQAKPAGDRQFLS